MARQALLPSLPFPVLVSETGTRQSNLSGVVVSEAAAIASYSLSLDSISSALSPQTVALNKGFSLVTARVNYSLTLGTISYRAARRLAPESVAYVLDLASVNPVLAMAHTAYVSELQDLTLTYTPVTTKLVLESISFGLELEDLALQWQRPLAVETVSFTTSLQTIGLLRPYRIYIDAVSISLSLSGVALAAPLIIAYPLYARTITI